MAPAGARQEVVRSKRFAPLRRPWSLPCAHHPKRESQSLIQRARPSHLDTTMNDDNSNNENNKNIKNIKNNKNKMNKSEKNCCTDHCTCEITCPFCQTNFLELIRTIWKDKYSENPTKYQNAFGNPDVMSDDDIKDFFWGDFVDMIQECGMGDMPLEHAAYLIAVLSKPRAPAMLDNHR
jgi:hypothetical protein